MQNSPTGPIPYYPLNMNICGSQDNFNHAFDKAVRYTEKENLKKVKPWVYVSATLWLVFFVWALLLAMQVEAGQNRLVHLVLAMVFSPVYVLSYYIGVVSDDKNVVMSMGKFY
jgi:hypothetical protein